MLKHPNAAEHGNGDFPEMIKFVQEKSMQDIESSLRVSQESFTELEKVKSVVSTGYTTAGANLIYTAM